MREIEVVKKVESQLKAKARYYNNNHGSVFSKNGTPDFITNDKDGYYLAIEVKAPKKTPYANQYRRALEILISGGRFVVAQDDFSLNKTDNHDLPIVEIKEIEIGKTEFELLDLTLNCTTEFIYVRKDF